MYNISIITKDMGKIPFSKMDGKSCSYLLNLPRNNRNILIIVDMQNDFVFGKLGNAQTQETEEEILNELATNSDKYDMIIYTRDCHDSDYLNTLEGKKLPVEHCIVGTKGAELTDAIQLQMNWLASNGKPVMIVNKETFGSTDLAFLINDYLICNTDTIYLAGVCTDICVVSNALYLRTMFPNTQIKVLSSCCAGTSIKAHFDSLTVMENCNIDIEY